MGFYDIVLGGQKTVGLFDNEGEMHIVKIFFGLVILTGFVFSETMAMLVALGLIVSATIFGYFCYIKEVTLQKKLRGEK